MKEKVYIYNTKLNGYIGHSGSTWGVLYPTTTSAYLFVKNSDRFRNYKYIEKDTTGWEDLEKIYVVKEFYPELYKSIESDKRWKDASVSGYIAKCLSGKYFRKGDFKEVSDKDLKVISLEKSYLTIPEEDKQCSAWIARDDDGELSIFTECPTKNDNGIWTSESGILSKSVLPGTSYPWLSPGNGPIEVIIKPN